VTKLTEDDSMEDTKYDVKKTKIKWPDMERKAVLGEVIHR
jgi:hypothetical protein